MKKKIILLVLSTVALFANIPQSAACDVCGCGVGSYYMGILPDFNKRFIGLRYQQNRLQTHLGSNGIRTPNSTNETYRTMELWGLGTLGSAGA